MQLRRPIMAMLSLKMTNGRKVSRRLVKSPTSIRLRAISKSDWKVISTPLTKFESVL